MAARLASLSELMYDISNRPDKNEATKVAIRCRQCIPEDDIRVDFFYSTGTNTRADNAVLIVKTSSDIYIVFKGTTSFVNWSQNLKVWPRSFPISTNIRAGKGEVHSGFFDAQDSLWPSLQVHDMFQRPQREHQQDRGLWIAGHSLGGAMAIITAARLATELGVERIDGVYTFGSPGLFNCAAVAQYDGNAVLKGRTFRIKYRLDLVTRLPSCIYENPGTSVRVTERDGMAAHLRPANKALRLVLELSRKQDLGASDLVLGARAHDMRDNYLATVGRVADQTGTGTFVLLGSSARR